MVKKPVFSRIQEIDQRIREIDRLLKSRSATPPPAIERQFWADREEERRLLIDERQRLLPN